MFDKKHNTLVYLAVSTKIVEGSPQNSISTVTHYALGWKVESDLQIDVYGQPASAAAKFHHSLSRYLEISEKSCRPDGAENSSPRSRPVFIGVTLRGVARAVYAI